MHKIEGADMFFQRLQKPLLLKTGDVLEKEGMEKPDMRFDSGRICPLPHGLGCSTCPFVCTGEL